MTRETVHLAIYDTMADWEVGYISLFLNTQIQRLELEQQAAEIRSVGAVRF